MPASNATVEGGGWIHSLHGHGRPAILIPLSFPPSIPDSQTSPLLTPRLAAEVIPEAPLSSLSLPPTSPPLPLASTVSGSRRPSSSIPSLRRPLLPSSRTPPLVLCDQPRLAGALCGCVQVAQPGSRQPPGRAVSRELPLPLPLPGRSPCAPFYLC